MKPALTENEQQKIKSILKEQGCFDYVITEGIYGLLARWETFVEECEKGYFDLIEEYRNDLTTRDLIEMIFDAVEDTSLINKLKVVVNSLDQRFLVLLVDRDKCIWGKPNEPKYAEKKYWWYWGIVKNAKGDLLRILQGDRYFTYYQNSP